MSMETIVILIIVLIVLILVVFFVLKYGGGLGSVIKDQASNSVSLLPNASQLP